MPQMFPMNWFLMYNFFSFLFLLLTTHMFFIFSQPLLNTSFINKASLSKWLW